LNPARIFFRVPLARAAAFDPHAAAGVTSSSGETPLFSIVIAFGVATLVATGLLFLLQISEDFRNA
jgi:hypothetical protein